MLWKGPQSCLPKAFWRFRRYYAGWGESRNSQFPERLRKKRSRNIQCLLWLRQTMLSRHNRIKDESISRKKLSQHFHNINFNVALKGNLQVLQRSMGTSRVEKEHKHLFSIMLQTFSFTQHTSNEIIKQSLININLTWARVINRNITVLRNDWD